MSTPSTATALAPIEIANLQYYGNYPLGLPNPYSAPSNSRLQAPPFYNPPTRSLTGNASIPSLGPTRTNSSAMVPPKGQPPASTSSPASRKRRSPPDWEKFYENGVPKEVIVIDDTPPPSAASSSARVGNGVVQYPVGTSAAHPAQPRHTDKKRKVETKAEYPYDHEQLYSQAGSVHPAYSTTQTPQRNAYNNSPATLSAQSSTGSVNDTTAGTSLGSNRSMNDALVAASLLPQANGGKRKRVTRASHAAAAAANTEDAFASYHPPPKPPIKAKEVHVNVIQDDIRSSSQRVDDQDGHYIVTPDTELTPRYRITKLLGQGTFGKVVEAYDRVKRTKAAIKVIRSVQKYRDASRVELRVLSTLALNDPDNKNKCIHLRDCFDYKNHICIVTDLLGMSVFDFLKANQFAPFPSSHIQSFARQLLTSVAFLHDLNLIHTDLKPENILLVNNGYHNYSYTRPIPSSSTNSSRTGRTRRVLLDTDIRLIDFGSATFDDEYHSAVVSTRHYRAPEIILGLGWTKPCDIWSIGCILVEFFTGDALFQTHDNLEHLAMMQAVCGPKIDSKLIRQMGNNRTSSSASNPASKYFKGARLDYPNAQTTRASRKYVNAMKPLQDIIPVKTNFDKQFLDLLKKIFVYDPNRRITATDALRHPWFRETIKDEGTEAAQATAARAEDQARAKAYRESEGAGPL